MILRRALVLARIATLASASGIVAALGGRGISLDVVHGSLTHDGHLLTIADGLLSGPSLRVLFDGTAPPIPSSCTARSCRRTTG
jgi:hypothetical protein